MRSLLAVRGACDRGASLPQRAGSALLAVSSLLALALVLPACSALGLDNLPQADCVRGATDPADLDAYCASLATLVPPEDTCHTWQCNEQTRHCEILPRDDDQDEAPSMMCAEPGQTPDCDDADGNNTPDAPEQCNLADDDCDGVIDESIIETTIMSSSLATIGASTRSLFASQPDSDDAMLLWRSTFTFHRVVVPSAAAADLTFRDAMGAAISLQDADGAITAVSAGSYAMVARRGSAGCQQWSLFSLPSEASAVMLRTGDETLLPACTGSQQVTAPALAALTNGLTLVSWMPGASVERTCGTAPAGTITLSAARLARTPPNRVGTEVITLGDSVDTGPAAMLALSDAFLVAYPKADGSVDVHLVTVDPATLTISGHDVVYTEPAGTDGMPRTGVGLALGPTDGAATTIALSYVDGCSLETPITVRLLTRSGSTVTGSSTPTTGLGTGRVRRFVQVAWQPRTEEWLVAWRSGMALSVQRLFREGAPAGDPFDLVPSPDSDPVTAFGIDALGAGPLYRATIVRGMAVSQITFGCGGT